MVDETSNTEQSRVAADCPNKRLVMLQNSLQALRDLTQVQCTDGNWNCDPYMHGMANGMIFALSLFEAGEPKYLDAPAEWLKDRPTPEVVSEASATQQRNMTKIEE